MAVSVELLSTEVAALKVLFEVRTYSYTPKAVEVRPVIVVLPGVVLFDVDPDAREALVVPLLMSVRYMTTESAMTV